jgi:alpha-glucosidase
MKDVTIGLFIAVVCLLGSARVQAQTTITVQKGEKWFGGAVNEAHLMPFKNGYVLDMNGDTRGNQAAPLLISTHGRFVWSEDPFAFSFTQDKLVIREAKGVLTIDSTALDLRQAFLRASKRFFPAKNKLPDTLLFSRPQYNTWIELDYNQNERAILAYARAIVKHGFPTGVLMIDDNWADYYGRFDFRHDRFENAAAMIDTLHQLGFKVMLWVSPFVSPDTEVFRELLSKKLLLFSAGGDSTLVWAKAEKPAIIPWWNGYSAVLDLTNAAASAWFVGRLHYMQATYHLDGFKLDAGDADFYPTDAVSFSKVSPNEQSRLWGEIGLQFPLNEYRAMWKMGGEPLVERLRDKQHTWVDLQKLIPHITTAGLLGYQFTCPDMIGGGEFGSFRDGGKLDEELIVRSAECSALMPMMQFSVAPWRVLSDSNLRIVQRIVAVRLKYTPYILELARSAAVTGEPIVRSMEYAFPNQGFSDEKGQFMLGEKYVVAPVLTKEGDKTILLPKGQWRDDKGKVWKGPCRITGPVSLDRLPVFERLNIDRAQDTIRITDLGYEPGSRGNAVPFVQKALKLCGDKPSAVLDFPPGRYDFWPEYSEEKMYYESNTDVIPLRRCPILLNNLHNLILEGNNAEFVFHDRMQPITIDNCTDIAIKDVNVDWDVPLTAQARIKSVANDHIDIAVDPVAYPYTIEQGKLVFLGEGWKSAWWDAMEFDSATRQIVPGTADECLGEGFQDYTAEVLPSGLIRLHYPFKRKPAPGNMLVLRHSKRDHAGVFIYNSRNITIDRLNLYHTAGLGILSQYSEDLTFESVHCVPNPAKNRYFSGHDDGMHFSNCKGRINVDSCTFQGLMDDPINVHGTSVQVIERLNDQRVRCKFMHEQSIGFEWARIGDTIGLIDHETMVTIGKAVVKAFDPSDPQIFELTFNGPLAPKLGVADALENLTWTPDVWIHNSYFGSNRARGILVSTPGKVVIEHNVFESSGSAILIPGDANAWFESGAVHDVLISNNDFKETCLTSIYQFCEAIISVDPEIPKLDPTKPFHRNIRIENNTFHPFDYPILFAKSTRGLTFVDNKIIHSTRYTPFHPNHSMISLVACSDITIKGNQLTADVRGKSIRLDATPAKALKLDKKQGIAVKVL